ncbi:hypothetical protein [Mycolicibacter minnesotensis]
MVSKWLRGRGVWFWAITITVASVLLLWGGSQIAHDHGQRVDWYTGFGQWLGALGSLIAAGVALWIAVTDRRHAARQRDADLSREAALVQVSAERFNPCGIRVMNRRTDRIFDIEVTRFVQYGSEVAPLAISHIDVHPTTEQVRYPWAELRHLAVAVDQAAYIYPNGIPDVPADYAAVAYTDSRGRRWEVDTDGGVRRRV